MDDLFFFGGGGAPIHAFQCFSAADSQRKRREPIKCPAQLTPLRCVHFSAWHRRHPELSGLTDDALFHNPQQTLQHNRTSKGGTTRIHYDNTENTDIWLKDLYPYILWRVS